MSDLDKLMDDANRSLHSCDLCGMMICEHFEISQSDDMIRAGRFDGDLWICCECEPMTKGESDGKA